MSSQEWTIEELPPLEIESCSLCRRDGKWVMETIFSNGYFYESTIPDAVIQKLNEMTEKSWVNAEAASVV